MEVLEEAIKSRRTLRGIITSAHSYVHTGVEKLRPATIPKTAPLQSINSGLENLSNQKTKS